MDAKTALLTRRSVRSYRSDPIPKDVLDRILSAGTYAPSGMNRQSAVILAVTDKKTRDKLSQINARVMGVEGKDPFYGAPVVLVVLANKDMPTYVYDGSLVMGNLMLAAHTEGIASCWIHRAKETFQTNEGKALLKDLGIEGEYEGIGNCILGYTDEPLPEAKPRKDNYIYYID